MLMRLDESSTQLYVALMLEMLRGYQRARKVPPQSGKAPESDGGAAASPSSERAIDIWTPFRWKPHRS